MHLRRLQFLGQFLRRSLPSPSASASTSAPGPTPPQQCRSVGIVGDYDSAALDVGKNLNMLLVGVDDGFVTLKQNVGDGMVMGAPQVRQTTWI